MLNDYILVKVNGFGLVWYDMWMSSRANWYIHTVRDGRSCPIIPLMTHGMPDRFDAGWFVLRLGRCLNPLPASLVRMSSVFVRNFMCLEWIGQVYLIWYYYR